ncbi:abl interactor 1-like isoform X2 [Stegostoma tigrinum]|uniref:abl interactor 1-like isoform X2 n=1 Tax=Stegostoma tigrinum TaxID=3053191 RepID=UPI0028704C01|nr:abl interactor 1-like isoform X2 [Stegostoma tigrinum]
MAEMQSLFEQDIPADRKLLLESFSNLQKVAEYCENNYIQAQDKTKALEETKAYAAQSLASVASQINSLAEKVFKLLDLQALELSKMESSVNFISQKVEMHKEKVARREIGTFAVAKTTSRMTKIIPPANPIQREKYTRKPIVYTLLDDTGHGVKEVSNHPVRSGTLSRRYGQTSMTSSTSQGTLGRSAKGARPVQPPVVPSAYSSPVTKSPPTEGSQMHSSNISRNKNICGTENMAMPLSVPVSMPPPPPAPAASAAFELGENDLPDVPPPPPMELPPPLAPPPQIFNEVCLPPPPPLLSDAPSASSASGYHNHFMWQGPQRDHSATPPASLRWRHSASSPAFLHRHVNDVPLSSPLAIGSPAPILPSSLQFIPQIPLTGFVARFQENINDCPPPPPPPPDFIVDLDEMTPPPPPPIDYLDDPQWIPANYIEKGPGVCRSISYSG